MCISSYSGVHFAAMLCWLHIMSLIFIFLTLRLSYAAPIKILYFSFVTDLDPDLDLGPNLPGADRSKTTGLTGITFCPGNADSI